MVLILQLHLFLSLNKISRVENKTGKQNAKLSQVPLPVTLWLLAPVLVGLTQLRRQKKYPLRLFH